MVPTTRNLTVPPTPSVLQGIFSLFERFWNNTACQNEEEGLARKFKGASTLVAHDWGFYPGTLSSGCNSFNSLRPRQNGRHFADDIFECIFLNENVWISLEISLKFGPEVRINNIPALVQIMAWRWPGDKPLSESMMVSLLTHICITRPQRVKDWAPIYFIYGCLQLSCSDLTKLAEAEWCVYASVT